MAWMTRKQVRSQPVQSHSEQQLQKLLSAFDRRMNRLNDDYLRRMGEHIRDIGTLWPSDVHRLQQIRRMNKNLRQLERRIAAAAGMGADDIAALFERVAQDDARMAAKILGVPDTVNVMDNLPLRRILQAQARETANRMRNLSNTTVVSSYYRKAIDEACAAVQSGVEDYNTAIRRVIREAGAHGLRVREDGSRAVDYESGWSRRLDSAARMNVLDGMRHLNQSIMEEVGRQFGADGVEIDAHMLCAEDHLPYQGQQFSNEAFEQIQDSLQRPFGEWNCRHSWHPIMLGISPPAWTPEQLSEMRRFSTEQITVDGRTKTRYKWSQEMRRIETAVRQQKDTANLARVTGDDVLRRRCQGNILELNRYYKELSEKVGLQPEFQRTYVAGFVDALPVGGAGPSVSTGGLQAANLGNHEQIITGMVGKADATVQAVWNKNAADLRVLDAHSSEWPHCEDRKGVKFDIEEAAKGNNYQAPYQLVFHELGHQIDYLSGKNGLPLSYTFRGNLLSQTAMRESRAHLDEYFRNNFAKYYPDLTRQQIILTNPTSRATLILADNYEMGKVNLDQVLQNRQVFDALKAMTGKRMELDFRDMVKDKYSERERVDISDIFEPATKVNYPFGFGHRGKDPAYWYRVSIHGTEIFAEMYSAEIGNHASLKALKEFYPETYKVFRDILEAIK